MLLLSYNTLANPQNGQTHDGFAIEISSKEKSKVTLYVSASDPVPENLFGTMQILGNQKARTQRGEVISGFKFVPHIECDALRVKVYALIETQEHSIASYLLKKGQTIQATIISQFGVEPYQIRVTDAQAIPISNNNQSSPLSVRVIDCFQRINERMNMRDVKRLCGKAERDLGSGIHFYVYDLDDGSVIRMGSPDDEQILYVIHALANGQERYLFRKR
jgi:hypothetical protein